MEFCWKKEQHIYSLVLPASGAAHKTGGCLRWRAHVAPGSVQHHVAVQLQRRGRHMVQCRLCLREVRERDLMRRARRGKISRGIIRESADRAQKKRSPAAAAVSVSSSHGHATKPRRTCLVHPHGMWGVPSFLFWCICILIFTFEPCLLWTKACSCTQTPVSSPSYIHRLVYRSHTFGCCEFLVCYYIVYYSSCLQGFSTNITQLH